MLMLTCACAYSGKRKKIKFPPPPHEESKGRRKGWRRTEQRGGECVYALCERPFCVSNLKLLRR